MARFLGPNREGASLTPERGLGTQAQRYLRTRCIFRENGSVHVM